MSATGAIPRRTYLARMATPPSMVRPIPRKRCSNAGVAGFAGGAPVPSANGTGSLLSERGFDARTGQVDGTGGNDYQRNQTEQQALAKHARRFGRCEHDK